MLIEVLDPMVDQEAVEVSQGVGPPHHRESEVIEIIEMIPHGLGQKALVIEFR